MKRLNRNDRRYASSPAKRRALTVGSHRRGAARTLAFEPLEGRRLLAVDFGDAPDASAAVGYGNYYTTLADNGPQHTIVVGLRIGANVDGDNGTLQNPKANADDLNPGFPGDDEDGLVNPVAELELTIGAQPRVNVRVTNTTAAFATLYGWIDYNANGLFENASERAMVVVPNGTNNATKTLVFPTVPAGSTGITFARFRLSTDAAAANSTGLAGDGEVEDYRVTIYPTSNGVADSSKSAKVDHDVVFGPSLLNGDYFGASVASLGDLDGDGVTDFAVGANGDDTYGLDRGAVHVVFMRADGTVKGTQKIAGNQLGASSGDYFGRSIASLGDLDGDGVTDLAVGAERRNSSSGAVFILYLNANGTLKGSRTLSSFINGLPEIPSSSNFGKSIAPIGDLDGDGITDIAVGATGADLGGTNRGAVYVLFMNANGTVKGNTVISHSANGGPALANNDFFGSSIASLGDLDGDGVTDLVVAAYGDDSGGVDRGALHVLFMIPNGTVKSRQKIASNIGDGPTLVDGDHFGLSLAMVGDLDGDGVRDLAVGAPGDDMSGPDRGAIHIVRLDPDGTAKASHKIGSVSNGGPTLANYDAFGNSVAFLGDFDGDGAPDLAVGAPGDDSGGTNRGAVHALFLQGNVLNSNPIITSPNNANVQESSTTVMTVTATDADAPPQTVTFSLVGGADQARFAITGAGALSFVAAPNFEAPSDANGDNVYVVTVQASDGQGGLATQTINVTITPVNESNPIFTSTATANVAENTTSVKTVTATDADLPAQTVTFSIVGGADQARFSITAGGALSFVSGRNFEVPTDANGDNVYVVTVQASDGQGGLATQTINVTVTPANEINPIFTSTATANVAENTTSVKTVTATDPDLPAQTVTFSIVGGADQARFSITAGGALSFVSGRNFEVPTDANGDNVYVVTVQASDGQGGLATQTINVTVTPVNDNNPVFTSTSSLNVPENTSAVMTVTATDTDLPAQTVTFSIVGGADQARFSITSSGVLSFIEAPDFEMPFDSNGDNGYVVRVQASDGQGGVTSLPEIVIRVTPVNDNTPLFTSTNTASVAENTTAVKTVTATDADLPGQTVTFSLAGGADQAKFSITAGGALSFLAAPNFEAPSDANGDNVYVVTVQASDGVGGTTTQTINVTVTPVNDNNPVFTSTNTASVAENTTAVKTVTATDADLPGQTVTFSLAGGADQAKFSITAGGALSFLAAPDFEAFADANGDNLYFVTVQASDGAGGTTTQTIFVSVTAVNDNVPAFTSSNVASVIENTTTVLTLTATDADFPVQSINFSLAGGADQAKFSITAGGALSFLAAPNFEAPTDANGDNVYVVTVQASDGAGGTTAQTINVTVLAAPTDYGDAPDSSLGTGAGDYQTLEIDNGPRHTIVAGLRIGATVDGLDGGVLQSAAANGDDVNGALPDDEDGLINPAADLTLTVGAQPTVSVRVTNTSGSAATLYGWIDANANGIFENATERASITVPNGTNNGIVTLTFPAIPVGFTGTTYARFRLSSDAAAANPTGAAVDGEVEDYRAKITLTSASAAAGAKTQKIAHNTNGGPLLANNDIFGSAAVSLGDLDGDGITDLAVGAQSQPYGIGNSGSVHIMFMNSNGTVKSGQKITSGVGGGPLLADGDYFGRSLANLGDLDGDGIVDLAVGADKDDTGGNLRGALYVLFLNANGTAKSTQKIAHNLGGGPTLLNEDRFGSAVANIGDLDGDGVVDVAVGANARGGVQVLFMNPNGTAKGSQKIDVGADHFGEAVAALGDLDGDGLSELAVGAPNSDTGGIDRGSVHIVFLNANGTVKATQRIANGEGGGPTLANSDFFGSSAAAVGDLDGDGVTDLAVGARYDDAGGDNRGAVYLLLMNSNGTAKNVQKIANNTGGGPTLANSDLFGRSVAAVGDLDGDGRIDLAVGAERDDTGGAVGSNRGALYVLFLTPKGDYDLDGDVDGTDFLTWQRGLGSIASPAGSGADGDVNGSVGGGDLAVWKSSFGGGTASLVVAEPAVTIASATSPAGASDDDAPQMQLVALGGAPTQTRRVRAWYRPAPEGTPRKVVRDEALGAWDIQRAGANDERSEEGFEQDFASAYDCALAELPDGSISLPTLKTPSQGRSRTR